MKCPVCTAELTTAGCPNFHNAGHNKARGLGPRSILVEDAHPVLDVMNLEERLKKLEDKVEMIYIEFIKETLK